MTWPLPALAAWGLAWGVYIALVALGAPAWVALAPATAVALLLAVWGTTPWRRVFIAAGFPLSLLASGIAGALPAWAWLLPVALLLLLYPLSSWRDAPLFPTPAGALGGLAMRAPLPAGQATIVDAGCGVGDGLRELHREYPAARLDGLEWSWPLRLVCAWRCPFARIRRADIWTADWSPYGMVYLFQRPESMPRAVEKAARELSPGAWLASLEFEATSLEPQQVLRCPDGRPVWLYQAPFETRADPPGPSVGASAPPHRRHALPGASSHRERRSVSE